MLPNNTKRAIIRARDDKFFHPFPNLDLAGCQALHLDGHQGDAALHYAKICRQNGILTSLDGGGLRGNLDTLLDLIDVAIVAERLCEQMKLSPQQMLEYLKGKGCKIGGVTQGERGLYWYDEGGEVSTLPALPVPKEKIIDTSGAGDIFHGAYVASYLAAPEKGLRRISVSPVPRRPTKSRVSAMKLDCRRRPMSLRSCRNMQHSVFE